MSGPRAAVRITVTAAHLEGGWFGQEALREIQGLLFDVPAQALVHLDLGPLRHVDDNLVQALAWLPCAQQVRFESPSWRVAQESALALTVLLATQGVTAP